MIDDVQLQFDPGSLIALNVVLGLIMFGVSLDLTVDDFKRVLKEPRGAITGLTTQLLVLPAVTVGLALVMQPPTSVALGMILVASCPGGNMSNFLTHLGGGNTGLSVSITSVASVGSVLATPINFALWGQFIPGSDELLRDIDVNAFTMLLNILMVIAVPLFLGMLVNARKEAWARKLRKPLRWISILALGAFIAIALANNWQPFLDHIDKIFATVAIHNAVAFSIGFGIATLAGLAVRDRRAVTMEVGIQNSGLGLVLIFTYFNGLGGMAIIAAWWGIWHLIAGGTLAVFWHRRGLPKAS